MNIRKLKRRLDEMPPTLRVITIACLGAIIFAPIALFPGNWSTSEGQTFTWQEFWARGYGPIVLCTGLILPAMALAWLAKVNLARHIASIALLCISAVAALSLTHVNAPICGTGIAAACALAWGIYLEFSPSVRYYFSDGG